MAQPQIKSPVNFQNLEGQRFGKLLVLKRLPTRITSNKNMRWKPFWLCRCDCGNECEKSSGQLKLKRNANCPACSSKKGIALTHGKYYTPEYKMFHSAKKRAKESGIPFDLELRDIVIPEFCPVLGIVLKSHRGSGRIAPFAGNSPTLDKIIPSLGYVKGNIRVICWRANHIKTDASLYELKKVVAYLENELKETDAEKNPVR